MSQRKYKLGMVCAAGVGLACVAAVWPVTAAAQEMHADTHGGWVATLQGNVESRGALDIGLARGAVEVHGKPGQTNVEWTAKVHIRSGSEDKARRMMAEQPVTVKVSGNKLEFRSDVFVDLVVVTPVKLTTVRLATGGGDLTLTDVAANAMLETEGGKIEADRVSGTLKAGTAGGDVTLKEAGANGVASKAETGAGRIFLDAGKGDWFVTTAGGSVVVTAVGGNLQVETGGGNVTVHQVSGNLQLQTAGGNVDIGDVGGWVTMETASGSIRLASARGMVKASSAVGSIECRQLGAGLHAETGGGGITAEFAKGTRMQASKLQTASGDVNVYMPEGASAAIKLSADNPWGHSIQVDFPTIRLTSTKEDGELRAEGLVNGGGPLLQVETGNGSVRVMKAK
jgi:DUF4097 and DUF4098 domain-containing protein YvlB